MMLVLQGAHPGWEQLSPDRRIPQGFKPTILLGFHLHFCKGTGRLPIKQDLHSSRNDAGDHRCNALSPLAALPARKESGASQATCPAQKCVAPILTIDFFRIENVAQLIAGETVETGVVGVQLGAELVKASIFPNGIIILPTERGQHEKDIHRFCGI
jgi:hypothetical protein